MKNINEKLIKYMYENLEDFGKDCAIDGKFLDTYANHYSKEKCEIEQNMMQQILVKHII